MPSFRIEREDPRTDDIAALILQHLAEMHETSPPDHVHAMAADALAGEGVSFFAARDGGTLAAIGALREVEPGHGELKSMRAAPAYRGKGTGRAMLDHLIGEARARGYTRLSLETGNTRDFADAIRLYERNGFTRCPAFADYSDNDFSQCFTREI